MKTISEIVMKALVFGPRDINEVREIVDSVEKLNHDHSVNVPQVVETVHIHDCKRAHTSPLAKAALDQVNRSLKDVIESNDITDIGDLGKRLEELEDLIT